VVEATSGACPICGEQFDEVDGYRAHLADEHDLHDADGAESTFGLLALTAPVPAAPQLQNDLIEPPRGRPAGPGERGRPVGLLVLVLALLVGFGALVAFGPQRNGDDEEVAQLTADDPTTTAAAGEARGPAAAEPPAKGGDAAPVAASGGGAPASAPSTGPGHTTTTAAPGGGGSVTGPTTSSSSTTTTSASTSTTASPPTFAVPTTSGAQIEGCQRTKNTLRITYSWLFSGGVGWHAPAGYTAVGGGRYQDLVTVPRHTPSSIATVQVLDDGGSAHAVALHPVLQSSAC